MKKTFKNTSLVNDFKSTLLLANNSRFSGRLIITVANNKIWNLYFQSGLFAWASEVGEPNRHSYRLLAPYRNLVHQESFKSTLTGLSLCPDYGFLVLLAKEQKINLEQITALIKTNLVDILFDIFQALEQASGNKIKNGVEAKANFQLQWQLRVRPSKAGLLPSWCVLPVESILQETLQNWENWVNAGLTYYSPNLIPILKEPFLLQQQTSRPVYRNLVKMINAKRSLKDIAMLLQWDTLKVAQLLLPYVCQNLIVLSHKNNSSLADVLDSPLPQPLKISPLKSRTYSGKKEHLVICIDDSIETCRAMEKIIESNSYHCITIRDSVQVLPTLLKHRPDAIFLDLIMPIVNGYEICRQIRRITLFQETPIIILSGSDGIVDRVRAKKVGATDFLTKPIDPNKVKSKLRKYLPRKFGKATLTA